MKVVQWLETEVADRDSGLSARFAVIPKAALLDKEVLSQIGTSCASSTC